MNTPITIAHGDGIGPEIMEATLAILQAADAKIAPEKIEIGESVYRRGFTSGIEPSAWESLRRTKVFLKSPITTPQGSGYKSLNVTIRKTLGLYANIRPCVAYAPFIHTHHPQMDVVIIRENEEDLYAGIEHQQTDQVMQCLKLITRPGCEKIIRYAFEYARLHNRRKVTCMTKDNIMKLTDGLFHRVFNEIAAEYPDKQTEHLIIDIGAARLADTPERFDLIVTPNLYGDIISDIAAQIAGSVGIAPSANLGEHGAMFEAIHGSAPDIAGQGIANPSGLLLAAIIMLIHIKQPDIATRIHNAWLKTIEDGQHTFDIYTENMSQTRLSTHKFTQAIIDRLGQQPEKLRPVSYTTPQQPPVEKPIQKIMPRPQMKKDLVGVDIFLHWREGSAEQLGTQLEKINAEGLKLTMITNRGVKVYPNGLPETFCTDHWRCRFIATNKTITHTHIISLLQALEQAQFDFIKSENLCNFDGEPGYALGQGQ